MPKITIHEQDFSGVQYMGDEVVVLHTGNCSIVTDKEDKNNCV